MPYQVKDGQQVDDGEKVYRSGAFVPGSKGELADMEAIGVVEWKDAPVREAKKPASVAKPKVVKR